MTLPPRFPRLLVVLGLLALSAPAGRGQDGQPVPPRLEGVIPGGARRSVTENWGALNFSVVNTNPDGRDVRVLVFYPEQPDVQYGRDVWVPGRSQLSSWMLAGPAAAQTSGISREIQFLIYDRTGGGDRLLRPRGDVPIRSRAVLYQKRVPTTAILLDDPDAEWDGSPAGQSLLLARTWRLARGLGEPVSVVRDTFLPPAPEAFDGIDQFVLAGNRLADDPLGRQALRRWVERGGTLWVMLDAVDPDVVAPLLGDDPGFHVLDRVGLTTVRLVRTGEDPAKAEAREHEQPVDLVRVALAGGETVLYTVNGWPAAFTRQVGRGKVLVTTLGPHGWFRPRTAREPRAPFEHYPDLPVPLQPLERLGTELLPEPVSGGFGPDDLRPLLTEQVGYAVVGRGTVGLILAAFLLVLLALGLALRRSRRPELVGWLGPAAAVAAAGLFVLLGEASRRAVPPTAGVAEVAFASPGGEAALSGVFGVYRPESGPAGLGSERGGRLELDGAGLEGQPRRWVLTDLDAWHLENLSLPAGLRLGTFRSTARAGPLSAVARFAPDGVEGRLSVGRFRTPADSLIVTPAREPVAVRLGSDGAFAAGPGDVLPSDQYLTGTVLTDRQQRRQEVYRKLLTDPVPRELEGRDLLLAWAEPDELPFTAEGAERTVGTALLVVPLEFERPATGTRVTVPRGFVPYTRLLDGAPVVPVRESTAPADMHLRFQLPPSVLPLTVERATLFFKARAPSRRVSVDGFADGKPVPLYGAESPLDPVRVEITDARLLQPDGQGGLHLSLSVGEYVTAGGRPADAREAGTDTRWRIESLGLEVVGRTAAER